MIRIRCFSRVPNLYKIRTSFTGDICSSGIIKGKSSYVPLDSSRHRPILSYHCLPTPIENDVPIDQRMAAPFLLKTGVEEVFVYGT